MRVPTFIVGSHIGSAILEDSVAFAGIAIYCGAMQCEGITYIMQHIDGACQMIYTRTSRVVANPRHLLLPKYEHEERGARIRNCNIFQQLQHQAH